MAPGQQFIIKGGYPLKGKIRLSGAKNAATKMMVASLLTDEEVILENCPDLGDVQITAELCKMVGSKIKREAPKRDGEYFKNKNPKNYESHS